MTREIFRNGTPRKVHRTWVDETPIALEFNGLSYAVMMASPYDLEDYVTGFALSEGLAKSAHDIGAVHIAETELGIIARAHISGLGVEQLQERVRRRVAESSCGLCGIENLHEVARPLPQVSAHERPSAAAVFAALGRLREHQDMGRKTGAAHGAALADMAGDILIMREDVGRHNAVDKLIGACARAAHNMGRGFVISTARCSYEIVEKVVKAGGTSLVTISLPTSLAVARAKACGLTLYCLARDDSFLDLTG